MTDVFISYAREDQAAARMVATEVIRLGYRVWWDEDLPAHVRYGDVIAERITEAKALIVLWSGNAVGSEWVRAEADRAREARKLIQTALDGAQPPMPFSQFQVASLAGWQGEQNHPGWRRVRDSLAVLAPLEQPPPPPAWSPPPQAAPPPATTPARGMSLTMIGSLLIALVLLVALAIGMMTVPARETPERPSRTARRAPPPQPSPAAEPVDLSERTAPPLPTPSVAPASPPVPQTLTEPPEILPDSSERPLNDGDLAHLSRAQLRLARNEIYARRGRIFRDPVLAAHFARYPWYRPVSYGVILGPIEMANVQLIERFEGR